MNSRFYIAPLGQWEGVCEVPAGQVDSYLYHYKWPVRSSYVYTFGRGSSLEECLRIGWWMPMVDEDLVVDEGL